jgi:hypothetical protein
MVVATSCSEHKSTFTEADIQPESTYRHSKTFEFLYTIATPDL